MPSFVASNQTIKVQQRALVAVTASFGRQVVLCIGKLTCRIRKVAKPSSLQSKLQRLCFFETRHGSCADANRPQVSQGSEGVRGLSEVSHSTS